MRHNNFERDIPIRERLVEIRYRCIADSMTKNTDTLLDTVVAKKIQNPISYALLNWGHFARAKPIFKMPLVSWTDTESTDEV